MKIESSRTLVLPLTPDEAWQRLHRVTALPSWVPELDSVRLLRTGRLRMAARVGVHRRRWDARTLTVEGRRWVLASMTPGVGFHLELGVAPHPKGCEVRIRYQLHPPARWLMDRAPGLARRRGRLFSAALASAICVGGLALLPDTQLPRSVQALAYALVGLALIAVFALGSGPRFRARRERPLGLGLSGAIRASAGAPSTKG